jgi:alpha-L-rhamnosidase
MRQIRPTLQMLPTLWMRVSRVLTLAMAGVCATQLMAAPVHLQVDSRVHPIGLGATAPVLSWQSDATTQNWKQSAYQIYVAGSAEALGRGNADIWNSGRIASSDSVNVLYRGPALQSGRRYYWSVRVWDAQGKSTMAAEPAWWEMGLLTKSDWQGQWIRAGNAEQQAVLGRIQWLWLPHSNATSATQGTRAEFRYRLHLDSMPDAASMHVYVGGSFTAKVNGMTTGHKEEWSSFDREDIRNELRYGSGAAGDNAIVIEVDVPSSQDHATFPAAAAVAIRLGDLSGHDKWLESDASWQARELAPAASSAWMPAQVVGPLASHRFGVAPDRHSPAATPNRLVFGTTLLRKSFDAPRVPVSARLYITALGSYRAYLNGQPVDAYRLTPGFTDYRKRVLYQTYDVTHLVKSGENTLGAVLGAGWYGSPLLWSGTREFSGPDRLRAQLEITYSDGTHKVIATDNSWQTSWSPIVASTIYGGEDYDARLVQPGWNTAAFHPAQPWSSAIVDDADTPESVSAQPDQPIHQQLTVTPSAVTMVHNPATGKEDAVFNMGQNMVGVVRLRVHGPRGVIVRLRFAERLNPDGTVYTENLRDADATDIYTLSGDGEEQWSPDFTYHGFQYVEVSGYPGKPPLSAIEGLVWNSLPEVPSMRLATSSDLLNSMDKLGLWGQRGNFVSIPTDCPQRDERMGWMGDAGVFWRTGSYNFDIDAFSHKFVQDQDDAQNADGSFTNIAPNLLQGVEGDPGAPGWGDAGVIVPYATWLQYGDLDVLKQAWPGMTRWMDFILRTNPNHLRQKDLGPDYADWLAPDPHTPGDLVGTAYWALIARQMQTMATALGRSADARKYQDLYDTLRTAYQHQYIGADGKMPGDTQTDYVVTLYAGLAPPSLVSSMTDRLVANIQAHNNHLTTGFLGTPFLLSVLDANGRTDVAYTLLLTTGYPSWGYMVSKGATTWWERWNGDTGDPSMNSYNHYSFGSVMAWVYRRVAGIDTDPSGAGFHHILIRPRPDERLPHLEASYASPYGNIATDWTLDPAAQGGAFHLSVNLPANTSATVDLPGKDGSHVTQDGNPVTLPYRDGAYVADVGSGTYRFAVQP